MNHRSGRARAWLGAGLAAALAPAAGACRYNVRDLGFIEASAEDYTLLAVFDDATPGDTLTTEQRRLERACRDSNVHPAVLRRAEVARHPLAEVLSRITLTPLPARALCSPDGFATRLEALLPAPASVEALLAPSPIREKIATGCAQAFGVILLLEGTDSARNAAARAAIQAARREIEAGLADLPKAIAAPPELVTLAAPELSRDRVLCWSLGLAPRATDVPRVMVFYGQARWIGPLMAGPQISRANLVRLFAVIGADCECGLDLSWTRGTALPLRWTDDLHALAARGLGFDPANPLVRAEALRLIDRYRRDERGPNFPARAGAEAAALPSRPAAAPPRAHATNVADAFLPLAPAPNEARAPARSAAPDAATPLRLLEWAAALGLGLALAAGLLVLKKNRRD